MALNFKTLLATAGSCAFLVACGGGGSSSSSTTSTATTVTPTPAATPTPTPAATPTPTPTPTPVSSAPAVPDFVANEYPASAELKDLCEVVRPASDTDLFGNPRGDEQGELLHELFWLRSFMDETYLYFDQVTDSDPNGFTDRQAYFDERLTTMTTASGNLQDRFSFTQDTVSFETQSAGAPTFGYGASFAAIQTNVLPRDWRVSFTQEGSNADTAGFTRGARILTIDGVDFLNSTSGPDIDVIVEGLFPTAIGDDHVFGVRLPDGTETDITVTSESTTIEPVNAVEILQNGDDSVGYLHYHTFGPRTGEEQLFNAFAELSEAGVDDLVLDLRYNGGGLLILSAQLGYMIAGPESEGEVFYAQEFNSRSPNVNTVTGQAVQPFVFEPETLGVTLGFQPGQPFPSVDLPRVFVLTSAQSCSASEGVMNGLMGIGVEVIQIGTRTCGKATGQVPVENCGLTYLPLHFRGVNAAGFGDYDEGFAPGEMTGAAGPVIPGCEVNDDFSAPLGSPNEAMLSAALTYASTGSCPTAATAVSVQDVNGPLSSKVSNFGLSDPLMDSPRVKAFLAQDNLLKFDKTFSVGGGE